MAMSLPILWSSVLNKRQGNLIWIGLRKLEQYMDNNNKNMNKIEKLAGEYNATFTRLTVIESELTKECQKYVSWDTVQVSITGGGAPIVKAREEIDAVPLEDFVDHVNKHGNMSECAYGHLACV